MGEKNDLLKDAMIELLTRYRHHESGGLNESELFDLLEKECPGLLVAATAERLKEREIEGEIEGEEQDITKWEVDESEDDWSEVNQEIGRNNKKENAEL